MHAKFWLLSGVLILVAGASVRADEAFTVAVTGGRVRGGPRRSGALFAGIPYAQPPVGALRWRAPQPVKPWAGVRDAMRPGPSALQPDQGWNHSQRAVESEDCLYLNVLTSHWPASGRLPVIVYIHGGANIAGAGWDHLVENTTLPECGVVLVTLNYRLGVFGFFAHPGLTAESAHRASGNYGLQDQIAALRWVRANIARFGGDPENVTLMGQSAGGQDIGLLMVSPRARGLFEKAIIESGPLVSLDPSRDATLAEAERAGAELGKHAGKTDIAALRAMPAEALLAAAEQAQFRSRIAVDGWVLPEPAGVTFAAGHAAPVPLLIGSNAREFTYHGTLDALRAQIRRAYGDLAARALQLYGLAEGETPPPADPVLGDAGAQFLSDLIFRCPTSLVALWQSAAGRPVWRYQFSRTPIGHEAEGAAHSAELPYVFGEMKPNPLGKEYNEADRRISSEMQRYWVNFATTGDPNGAGLTTWAHYDAAARRYVEFTGDGTRADAGLRRKFVDLFRERFEEETTP
jgi:para-nitrobenzyl esterase